MAVQIPELKRFDPSAGEAAPTAKIEDSGINVAKDVAATTDALVQGGNKINSQLLEYQDQSSNLHAQAIANGIEAQKKQALAEIKALEGDPTQKYAEFAKRSAEMNQKVWADNPDLDDKTSTYLTAKLQSVDHHINDTAAIQQGLQTTVYQQKVFGAKVKLDQDTASQYVSVYGEGEQGKALFGAALDRIENGIVENGQVHGLVAPELDKDGSPLKGPDGKIVYSKTYDPILQQQIKGAQGQVIVSAVKQLAGSGHTDEAKAMLDQYSDRLTGKQLAELNKDHEDGVVTKNASAVAYSLRQLPLDEANKKLDQMDFKDPREYFKAKTLVSAANTTSQRALKVAQDKNWQTINDLVASQGLKTPDEIAADPNISKLSGDGMLSPTQRKALTQLGAPPKTSDSKALTTALDISSAQGFKGMSAAQFRETMTGIDNSHQKIFETQWRNQNDPNKVANNQFTTLANKSLEAQMLQSGVIKHSYGTQYGKKDLNTLNSAKMDMLDNVANIPNPTSNDINKAVKDYLGKTLKDRAFTPLGSSAPLQSSPKAVKGSASNLDAERAAGAQIQAAGANLSKALAAYKAANGGQSWTRAAGNQALAKYLDTK